MSVGMLPAPDLHDKRTSEQALYLDESDDQRTVGNTAATAIAAILACCGQVSLASTTARWQDSAWLDQTVAPHFSLSCGSPCP